MPAGAHELNTVCDCGQQHSIISSQLTGDYSIREKKRNAHHP